MKLNIKKIYCPDCQRMVQGQVQKPDNKTHILCSRCGKTIWIQDDIRWKYIGKGTIVK